MSENQATPSIAPKSIEKVRRKQIMKVRPDQIPLYARRFYMKALLDVVNYMESVDKYDLKKYGMNNWDGAASQIKEIMKEPDALFYYGEAKIPEEYFNKYLVKCALKVGELRKVKMEDALPCVCGAEPILEDWGKYCVCKCSKCEMRTAKISYKGYPDNADAVAVHLWNELEVNGLARDRKKVREAKNERKKKQSSV